MKPLFVVNFKNYAQTFSQDFVARLESAQSETFDIVYAPNLLIAQQVLSLTKRKVYIQHVDSVEEGAFTGQISISQAKALDFSGSLLNHAERQVSLENIKQTLEVAKDFPLLVCVRSIDQLRDVLELPVKMVAYEPPDLIGGAVSVTSAEPNILSQAVELASAKGVKLLCGAGVRTKEDVTKALELGCAGVLVSSAVCKAQDPAKTLEELSN